MMQSIAERRVKSLQKEFLLRVEEHPILHLLEPAEFNGLRKRVFRGTFEAYRLGVVGIEHTTTSLFEYFFGWLDEGVMATLPAKHRQDISELCFRAALESYRLGAMVAVDRERDAMP